MTATLSGSPPFTCVDGIPVGTPPPPALVDAVVVFEDPGIVPGDDMTSHKGTVTFIDNTVDRLTGTLTARATIANSDRALLPGQYVRIRIHAGDDTNALVVPQTAVGSSQLGKYVYVVGDKNIAQQKLVTTGPTDGDLISVAGVNEKDLVITVQDHRCSLSPLRRRKQKTRRPLLLARSINPVC